MSRKFISSILIAAIAATGLSVSAAPAQANDDLAKFLVGATALIIIGSALAGDDNPPKKVTQPAKPKPAHKTKKNRKLLPSKCLRVHQTYNGKMRMMGGKCLQNNYRHTQLLPNQCRTRIHTYNGPRRGYQMRCLRNHGFRIAQS